jgi:hypothetical protein
MESISGTQTRKLKLFFSYAHEDGALRGTGIMFNDSQIQQLWEKTQGHPAKLQAEADELYRQFRF